MALFKIKSWDLGNPDKISNESVHGNSEKELEDMYKLMNKGIKVVEKVDVNLSDMVKPIHEKDPNLDFMNSVFKPGQEPNIPIPPRPPQQQKPPVKEVTFRDGDNEYKIIDGQVYKKEWVEVNDDNYRVVNKRIEKLDWIPIGG